MSCEVTQQLQNLALGLVSLGTKLGFLKMQFPGTEMGPGAVFSKVLGQSVCSLCLRTLAPHHAASSLGQSHPRSSGVEGCSQGPRPQLRRQPPVSPQPPFLGVKIQQSQKHLNCPREVTQVIPNSKPLLGRSRSAKFSFCKETMSQHLGLKVQIQLEAAGGEVLGGRKRLRILGQG